MTVGEIILSAIATVVWGGTLWALARDARHWGDAWRTVREERMRRLENSDDLAVSS